jgi:glycosyltransferase involved in cell wall biosynthesis
LWYKRCVHALIRNDELDMFWAGSTLLPILPHNVRSLSTVYDLNHKVVPQSMTSSSLWAHRLFFDRDVRASNAVVAISQGTALRLNQLLGREADAVVYPAASPLFRAPPYEVVQKTLRAHNLSQPYLLAVGTLEPRKNLELLISVFIAMLQEGLLAGYQLVLAGGAGWKSARMNKLLSAHSDVVRVLGYVTDQDLPPLYSGSAAFVFPSVYEGFGIPALEARLCGARVLAADVPEIREACGGEGVFVTPDAKGIREGILTVLARPQVNPSFEAPTWMTGAAEMATQFRKLWRIQARSATRNND